MTLLMLVFSALLAVVQPVPTPSLSPDRILGLIREKFRSHRPPPPYVTYTMIRSQKTSQGYPDYVMSYTYHIWLRSSDRAALARKVFRDLYRGDDEFQRPAFNEDRDPGPPTADLFEPAPLHPHPVEYVPTPEASQAPLAVIGSVRAIGEYDYKVSLADTDNGVIHLKLTPIRDPDRNRLREIFADQSTYELRKIVATDKLFIDGTNQVYGVIFTENVSLLQGVPVVTDIHGVVGDGYNDDGREVDYKFRDISFPATLPDWYFNPKEYAKHKSDGPL